MNCSGLQLDAADLQGWKASTSSSMSSLAFQIPYGRVVRPDSRGDGTSVRRRYHCALDGCPPDQSRFVKLHLASLGSPARNCTRSWSFMLTACGSAVFPNLPSRGSVHVSTLVTEEPVDLIMSPECGQMQAVLLDSSCPTPRAAGSARC